MEIKIKIVFNYKANGQRISLAQKMDVKEVS